MRLSRLFPLVPFIVLPLFAMAASFPDVPASYPHRVAIEKLTDRGVISGNPDGNFRPYDPVDRASMLKMLYKAGGLTVDGGKKDCFPDVLKDSWYEGFVCDAVSRGFVQGYDNPSTNSGQAGKSFKPGRPVTRAEALKMSIVILNVPPEGEAAMLYNDVSSSEWFAPYVRTALVRKILPIPGQQGPSYSPHSLMERGEAAAYIWNALSAKLGASATSLPGASTISSAPATSQSSSVKDDRSDELKRQQQSEKDALAEDKKNTRQVNFPFSENTTFSGKQGLTFRFVLGTTLTTDIAATLTANGKVTCRLYRMQKDGFSTEYYLGLEDGTSCHLRTTLEAGEYQLQLYPGIADSAVTVTGKTTKGDGNDGFSEAKALITGKAKVEILDGNDLEDWYSFKVTQNTSATSVPGQQMMVRMTSTESGLGCLIYPMADVDLFGFSGPVCNETYLFPPGTYKVSIRHPLPRAARYTYSVEVK